MSFVAGPHPLQPAAERPYLELRFDQGVPVLVLDEGANVETLRAAIRNSLPDHLTAIAGRSTRLHLGSREITLFDLRRVIHVLKQDYSVEVTGLYVRRGAVHRFAERELKLKLFVTDDAPAPTPAPAPAPIAAAPHPLGTGRPGPGPAPVSADEEQDTEEIALLDGGMELISAQAILEPTAELEKLERVTLPHDIDAIDLVDAPGIPEPANPFAGHRLEQGAPTPIPQPDRREPAVREAFEFGQAQDTHPPDAGADLARRSCTLHRTLRSGAVVRFDGDLYVFGDVNPGAQVVATGNIVVLGALKGLAHAGAAGDEASFILAFDLRPTQLRIGRKIAVPPPRRSSAPPPSELATVQDGQIVIEAYRGRVRV